MEQPIGPPMEFRFKQESTLSASLRATPRTIPDLAVELYKGLPAPLMKFAELQVLAGLQKLQREGRAKQGGDGWQLHRMG